MEPPAALLTPCTIVTGFLGAGKTTLLNHLLTRSGRRIGCLVNEFGAVDIDSSLLKFPRSSGEAESSFGAGVVELSNGCICCTINDSLRAALKSLLERRYELDHIVIETTGIADPGPVLATLQLPEFADVLRCDAVVTVVDAASFASDTERDEHPASAPAAAVAAAPPPPTGATKEVGTGTTTTTTSSSSSSSSSSSGSSSNAVCFRQQLAAADLLLINKTDLLQPKTLESVCQRLERLAPAARLVRCQHGRAAPALILSGHAPDGPSSAAPPALGGAVCTVAAAAAPEWAMASRQQANARSSSSSSSSSSSHMDADRYQSVAFRSDKRLHAALFEAVRLSPEWRKVVRAKGFLTIAEAPGYDLIYQQAGGRVDVRVGGGGVATKGDRSGGGGGGADSGGCTLVMIGQSLDAAALLAKLEAACEQPEEVVAAEAEAEEAEAVGLAVELGCMACDEEGGAEEGVAQELADVAEAFARRVRSDTRFDAAATMALDGGRLVSFRMHGFYEINADELTWQLLEEINTGAASGATWLVPRRSAGDGGESKARAPPLELLMPLTAGSDAALRWKAVYNAVEVVMMGHFGAVFCGGCDCIDTGKLAGQVLT